MFVTLTVAVITMERDDYNLPLQLIPYFPIHYRHHGTTGHRPLMEWRVAALRLELFLVDGPF